MRVKGEVLGRLGGGSCESLDLTVVARFLLEIVVGVVFVLVGGGGERVRINQPKLLKLPPFLKLLGERGSVRAEEGGNKGGQEG